MLKYLIPILLPSLLFAAAPIAWDGDMLIESHVIKNIDFDKNLRGGLGFDEMSSDGVVNRSFGRDTAQFNNFRLILKPNILVNENIDIKNRWSLGTYFFGGDPYSGLSSAGNQGFTTRRTGSTTINMDHLYTHIKTDFGWFEIGRAPVNWGLGAYWNGGDESTAKFSDTQDSVNFNTRFGPIVLNVGYAKIAEGRLVGTGVDMNYSGSNATIPFRSTGLPTSGGSDDIDELFFSMLYDWKDPGIIFGIKMSARHGTTKQTQYLTNSVQTTSTSSNPAGTASTTTQVGINNKIDYKSWNFFVEKVFPFFETQNEFIIFDGEIGNLDADSRSENNGSVTIADNDKYKSWAFISENRFKLRKWKFHVNFGSVNGEDGFGSGVSNHGNIFKAAYLSANYQLGLFLFNTNFNNLGAAYSTGEGAYAGVYNVSITNARYINPKIQVSPNDSWDLYLSYLYADAIQVAQKAHYYFDHYRFQYFEAQENQHENLGWELDFGVKYNWNANFSLLLDLGFFSPGKYFEFDNKELPQIPRTDYVYGGQLRAAIKF